MTREEARQRQIDAGEAGKAVVGMTVTDAQSKLQEHGFSTMIDYRDGEVINLAAAMRLTIGRVRLQVEGEEVIGYAVG